MHRAGISLTALAKPANWPLLIAAEQKSNPRLVDPKGDSQAYRGCSAMFMGEAPNAHHAPAQRYLKNRRMGTICLIYTSSGLIPTFGTLCFVLR
jgi:hypothetical protein